MIFRLMYTNKFYELVVLNIDIVLVVFEYFYFLFFEPYALREFRKGSVHFIIYRGISLIRLKFLFSGLTQIDINTNVATLTNSSCLNEGFSEPILEANAL